MHRSIRAGVTALALCACTGEAPPPAADERASARPASAAENLVDPAIPPAIAGEGGWNYQRRSSVDLTGDGSPEEVVLTARVEMYRGRPAWDDGQPWQVYVETPDGTRTYVYAQRLQLGSLDLLVGRSEAGEPASVLLLEQLPDRVSVYEVSFQGSGRATTTVGFRRALDPRGEFASPQLP
jgi:hypothetical protein